MMTFLFLLDTVAIIIAWLGQHKAGIVLFSVGLVLSVLWFWHHVTSHLQIQL